MIWGIYNYKLHERKVFTLQVHGFFLSSPLLGLSANRRHHEAIEPIYDEDEMYLYAMETDANSNIIYFADHTVGNIKQKNLTSG